MFFFASHQEEGHNISLEVEFPAFTAAGSEGSADVADWEQHIDMYIYIYTHVQMYLHTTLLMFEGTHINEYIYMWIKINIDI